MLTTESVVDAGVRFVQEAGLERLSLRSVADRLGVTPMALYRHVDTAQALERAVVEAILAQIAPAPAGSSWNDAARSWVTRARPIFAAHPGLSRHVLTHWFQLPHALDWLESLLAAAESHGMDRLPAVAAVNAVFTFALMRAQMEESIRKAGVMVRKLPRGKTSAARWPRIKASAPEYEVAKIDVHFAYGLDVVLLGVERRQQ